MKRFFGRFKDPFCGVSHAIGAILSVIALVVLLYMSWGKPAAMLAFGWYGMALIALYSASALYHSLNVPEETADQLQHFDHAGIYLLISGTYVPVCVLALDRQLGMTLLAIEAVCATVGVVGTFVMKKFPTVLRVVLYLVMGWIAVGALGYIGAHWPHAAVMWLVGGGVVYTVGAVIYSIDRPHLIPGKFSAHDLWHLFVLGGSVCHFMLMVTYVARIP